MRSTFIPNGEIQDRLKACGKTIIFLTLCTHNENPCRCGFGVHALSSLCSSSTLRNFRWCPSVPASKHSTVPSSLVAGTCYEYSDTFGGLFQFPGAGGAVSICSQPRGLRPSDRATRLWPLPSKVAVACVCSRGKDGVHGGDCDFHRDLPRETGTGRPGRGTESRHRVPRLWGQSNWKPTQSFRVHPLLPFLSIA